jgi:esterase FrsA
MPKPFRDALRRLFITTCLLTRTTEHATRRLGAGYFLPALFVQRYAAMGGLDAAQFRDQLGGVRSFTDEAWCGYWNALAEAQLQAAEACVPGFASNPAGTQARAALAPWGAQVAALMSERGDPLGAAGGEGSSAQQALEALRCTVKAITYYQVSAFPGHTPGRLQAYHRSAQLFDGLTQVVAPLLGMTIERSAIEVNGETVKGYLATPAGSQRCPLVVVTNGLEGTVQELAIPLLRYHDSGLAVFFMEMPGTYAHRQRMSVASESIYHGVIEHLARHPRVDPGRIGLVGVSFGAYWAARLAATSRRLQCVVACGAPTHRTFQVSNTIGIPDIIVKALQHTTGATSLHGLMRALRALSLRPLYAQIQIPLLVINGDHDTLLSTQDSRDLAAQAPRATLKLYPDDDHCAMGHYREWLDLSQTWVRDQLMRVPGAA